jgi:hypothetical protein
MDMGDKQTNVVVHNPSSLSQSVSNSTTVGWATMDRTGKLIGHTALKNLSISNPDKKCMIMRICSCRAKWLMGERPPHVQICRSYTETGLCSYGKRCRFIHKSESSSTTASPVSADPQNVVHNNIMHRRLPIFQLICAASGDTDFWMHAAFLCVAATLNFRKIGILDRI